jgi:hypothetical protein
MSKNNKNSKKNLSYFYFFLNEPKKSLSIP